MPQFDPTHIEGAYITRLTRHTDERGYFQELIHSQKYPVGIFPNDGILQVSVSKNQRNTLRGMHASPYPKIVTVISGEVFDIICDVRKVGPTYRRWACFKLSEENRRQLIIPAGVAHGFLCVQDATILYLQGGLFGQGELDVNAFDPELGIAWPGEDSSFIMSSKDRLAKNLKDIHPGSNMLPRLRRILVIGATGQLGRVLCETYGRIHTICTCNETQKPGMLDFDMQSVKRDIFRLETIIDSIQPEVVFICAAYTWVDGCELDVERAKVINVDAPRHIAATARKYGSKLVYFSTDYVFEGHINKKWSEEDETVPVNTYGATKLAGERAVLNADPTSLILRTTGLYGPDEQQKNFVYQLCSKLLSGSTLSCAVDQFGAPTYSIDLARLAQFLVSRDEQGVFHCAGPNAYSRYDFAVLLAKQLGLNDKLIIPTTTQQLFMDTTKKLGAAARRGSYLGLSMMRLQREYAEDVESPLDVPEALKHWRKNGMSVDFPTTVRPSSA